MSRVLDIWRSWDAWQRAVAVSVAVLAIAGAAYGAYAIVRRPADVSNPQAKFVPKRKKHKKVVKAVNWPEYGLDDERTRYLPSNAVHPPFSRGWDFLSPSLLEFSPVYARQRLYVINKDATFYDLNAKKRGEDIWKRDPGALSASSPAYH